MPALVEFNSDFLAKSWQWLNDPEIKSLTLTPSFTKQDQINFYNSIPLKTNYWIKGISENNEPIGAMGLKSITDTEAEYWGYIGNKGYWGKGIGRFMVVEAIVKAQKLGLQTIYLQVSPENIRAKHLYSKMGFHEIASGDIEKYELKL